MMRNDQSPKKFGRTGKSSLLGMVMTSDAYVIH